MTFRKGSDEIVVDLNPKFKVGDTVAVKPKNHNGFTITTILCVHVDDAADSILYTLEEAGLKYLSGYWDQRAIYTVDYDSH